MAGAVGKALALLTVPFLSRALEPSGYGLADLATSLAAILTIVVMFAGDIPTARLASSGSPERRFTVYRAYVEATIACSLAVAVLLLPLSGLIAGGLWQAPGQASTAIVVLALVPVSAAQASLLTLQRLEGRAALYAALATVDLVSQLLLAVLLVGLGFGPIGVLLGFLGGSVVGLVAAAIPASQYMAARRDLALGRRLIAEGAGFLPAAILFIGADYVIRYIVLDSTGDAAVGFFAVAVRIASVMSLAGGAFALAWGPYGLGMSPGAATAKLFGRALTVFSLLSCLAAITLAALAPEMVAVFSGQAYGPAAVMLPGLLVAAATAGAAYIVIIAAGVSQRGAVVAVTSAAAALVQIGLTAVLLPPMGLAAVGMGAMASRMLQIGLLSVGLGSSAIRVQRLTLPLFALAAFVAVVLQVANHDPAETRVLRTIVAGCCIVVGMITVAVFFRSAQSGHANHHRVD